MFGLKKKLQDEIDKKIKEAKEAAEKKIKDEIKKRV